MITDDETKRIAKIVIGAIIASQMIAVALVIAVTAHEAHTGQRYDIECCSGNDCAPATAVTLNLDGSRTITNGNGHTARFEASFKHRPSTDGKLHACISPSTGKPLCLYASEGM